MSIKAIFEAHIFDLQNRICKGLEHADTQGQFVEDQWQRDGGGGGKTRILNNGKVIEKGGVNVSVVHGDLPELFKEKFKVDEATFYACGLSLVIHPKSPKVPTVHANWRYFELYDSQGNIADQWFGGGLDLTPYYLFEEDAKHFHRICKSACDQHDLSFYPKFKIRCDEYFWNTHRNEARGIGGLFFDYLKAEEKPMEQWYAFVTQVADNFLEAYLPIVEKRKDNAYTAAQKNWQEIRRGRYVEFNLVHDKGTLFGLKTNGRIESILMSLPPKVQWKYDHSPSPDSPEEELIKVLKEPKNWT